MPRFRLILFAAAAVIAAALVGCESQLGVEQAVFACGTDEDCGDGAVCHDRVCRTPEALADLETLCTRYCQEFDALCDGVGTLSADQKFANTERCLQVCSTYPTNATDDAYQGNSVQCRVNHLQAARDENNPQLHCRHAVSSSDGTCGKPTSRRCLDYCSTMVNVCTGDNEIFDSPQSCLEACAKYSTQGSPGDSSGDTLQCRRAHAEGVTPESAELPLSCERAGPDSDKCVDDS